MGHDVMLKCNHCYDETICDPSFLIKKQHFSRPSSHLGRLPRRCFFPSSIRLLPSSLVDNIHGQQSIWLSRSSGTGTVTPFGHASRLKCAQTAQGKAKCERAGQWLVLEFLYISQLTPPFAFLWTYVASVVHANCKSWTLEIQEKNICCGGRSTIKQWMRAHGTDRKRLKIGLCTMAGAHTKTPRVVKSTTTGRRQQEWGGHSRDVQTEDHIIESCAFHFTPLGIADRTICFNELYLWGVHETCTKSKNPAKVFDLRNHSI